MERSLAGMLFLVAGALLSVAAGGWWMQRILFTPDDTRATAAAILAEPDIRNDINNVVSSVAAPTIGRTIPDLHTFLETKVLSTRAGAGMMGPIIEQAHDRIIGNRDDDPVVLTGDQIVEIVRDQHAADTPDVTLPINPIGTLRTARTVVGWMIPISAGLAVVAALFGLFTRPERRDLIRGLGEFALALTVSMLVFGYLIPVHVLTALDNGTWAHVMPRLAMRTLPVVLGSAVIFGVVGAALILASTTGGKRRQSSTPLSVARYRGGHNAGWS